MQSVLARLRNPVRHYEWGAYDVIAQLEGRPAPTPTPEAELWLGAHPTSPSTWLVDGEALALDAAIAAQPEHMLGPDVYETYGPRLPFLLKVLAVASPLSLQAHPTASQAEIGFAREQAAGIPISAPQRNYTDPWPKPELVRALTRFEALCGFRSIPATLTLLDALAVDELRWLTDSLRDGRPVQLHAAVERLLLLPEPARGDLVTTVGAACDRLAAQGGAFAAEARWTASLSAQYPADPGVIVSLLLDLVRLEPGESMHIPPGTLHSYLSGTCVEIMASSDSVLRGGLTSKHVDVAELLRVVTPRADGPTRVRPIGDGAERVHAVSVEHFRLSELRLDGKGVRLDDRGPQILLVIQGTAEVAAQRSTTLPLGAGQSAFVAAAAHDVSIRGEATIFRATVGNAVARPR